MVDPLNPPLITDPAWQVWCDALIAQRLAQCPRQRSQTFYFSQSGNDLAGDGSITSPYKTLSKARWVLDNHPGGDVALLFRRGDIWRDAFGIVTSVPNITIADYGAGTKPLFTAFEPINPASWTPSPGFINIYQRNESSVVTWVKESDDLDRPYSRQSTPLKVSLYEGSWYWDSDAGLLYIHPYHLNGQVTDPRVDGKPYELVRPRDSGVLVSGTGTRVENIRAWGWGMQLNASNQNMGIQTRVSDDGVAAVIGCESYYNSSHAIAHWSSRGGYATFIDCKAGLTLYNGLAGETVYNTFSALGHHQTIFQGCVATHGTLPTSDFAYAITRRARGFYGHGDGYPTRIADLIISRDCVIENRPNGCGNPSLFANIPPATNLADVRVFIVNERFEGGPGTGKSFSIASDNIVRMNGQYLAIRPEPLGSGALAGFRQNGWAINCLFEFDASLQSGRIGFWKTQSTLTSRAKLWYCHFKIQTVSGVVVRMDRKKPHRSQDAEMINCIVSHTGQGKFELALGTLWANAIHNVLLLLNEGVPPEPGPADGAGGGAQISWNSAGGVDGIGQADVSLNAPPPDLSWRDNIVLGSTPVMGIPPPCGSPMRCAAAPIPGATVMYDLLGPVTERNDIGPLEAFMCADLNHDQIVDVMDFFLFVSLFAQQSLEVDLNNDRVVDVLDFFVFMRGLENPCT